MHRLGVSGQLCGVRAVRNHPKLSTEAEGRERKGAPVGIEGCPFGPPEAGLALQVGELLEDLVGGGDDAGVGLETTLRDDEVGEFLRQVDV